MALRIAIGVLSAIVFWPAFRKIARGRKRLDDPETTILIYRTWEGQ